MVKLRGPWSHVGKSMYLFSRPLSTIHTYIVQSVGSSHGYRDKFWLLLQFHLMNGGINRTTSLPSYGDSWDMRRINNVTNESARQRLSWRRHWSACHASKLAQWPACHAALPTTLSWHISFCFVM
ncbi:hypothetical protein HAX54_039499 [Datura stramonium]|uniref:Uncharacterized protein n=1 Tax=Datura stramonium TaxID=4076 RepID=A0ABS8VN63_DATST|nr:hypothetical protein [Datura stramonium]